MVLVMAEPEVVRVKVVSAVVLVTAVLVVLARVGLVVDEMVDEVMDMVEIAAAVAGMVDLVMVGIQEVVAAMVGMEREVNIPVTRAPLVGMEETTVEIRSVPGTKRQLLPTLSVLSQFFDFSPRASA
ncbi:hypothetical protein BT69DRAFT_542885 [Atractiella rhizophila]|nr:hypothetical protein BT69DRAFT_542885 [Atractiella rhizophila]